MSRSSPVLNVLFLWEVPPYVMARLEAALIDIRERFALVVPPDTVESTLIHLAQDADILVGWRPSDAVLEAASGAAWIINPGAGIQHLVERVREHNVRRSTPLQIANGHGNAYATAQGAFALLLALTNRVVAHHGWMSSGRWRTGDRDAPSVLMRDRTLGLLGYGAVNRNLHRFVEPLGPRVLALRSSWSTEEHGTAEHGAAEDGAAEHGTAASGRDREQANALERPGATSPGDGRFDSVGSMTPDDRFTPVEVLPADARYTPAELDRFLDAVDTLVVALPLTDATRGMLGLPELSRLGPTGLLVNVGRGPVVDEAALYWALAEGRIAGAAIDVWYDYDPQPDAAGGRHPYGAAEHPFHTLPNVVLSPHRAASPFADIARWDDVAATLRQIALGQSPSNRVVLERGY